MAPIKVGIVGFGVSGRIFHGQLLKGLPQYEVEAVVTSQEALLHKEFPEATAVKSVEELIDRKLDLVILATPTSTHFELAKKILQSGKNLVVEKPFVVSSDEGRELIQLAKNHGAILSIYHNRRWDSGFLTIKKLLEEKAVGVPSLYISRFDRYRPVVNTYRWREQALPGSGLLYDIGSHLIDQALQLFGKPEWLNADLQIQRLGGLQPDYFNITLGYGTMRAILSASCMVQSELPSFELHGDGGSFVKYGMDQQESQLRLGMTPGDLNWGKESPEFNGQLTKTFNDLQARSIVATSLGKYEEFYSTLELSIRSKAMPPVSAEEAVKVIEILESCLTSSNSQQRIIL